MANTVVSNWFTFLEDAAYFKEKLQSVSLRLLNAKALCILKRYTFFSLAVFLFLCFLPQ